VIDVVPDDKSIAESNGWTLEAFREYVGQRLEDVHHSLAEMDLRYQQRFDAQEKAMAAALMAADRAVLKAETASEKRFESVNEFRAVLTAQSATLATKSEVEAAIKGLIDKIDGPSGVARLLDRYMSRDSGRSEETTAVKTQRNQSMTIAVAVGVGILAATISLVSMLTRAPQVSYQQPPQIGTPVKPN
jgi:hypothetical protein